MENARRLCRITGLTSPKGLQLNGCAGRILDSQGNRFPVCIDGHPGGPVSLKCSNIEILPDDAFDGGVGVGRGTLRDSQFKAIVVNQRSGQIITELRVSGSSARSRGCLMVIEEFLKNHRRGRERGSLLLMPTDLNVARALNRISTGDPDVNLDTPLKGTLKSVAKLLRRETETGNMVLIKYEPHRISADSEKRLGAGRHKAVLAGAFKVYPCPYEDYHDAMEVRYVDGTSKDQAVVKHEIYLDYGCEEAESYARHAVALGESDRLSPSTLAQVDPQAFWSAALHAEAFVEALESCECSRLVEEWKGMVQGVLKGRELWTKEASESSITSLPPVVVAGDGNNWGIRSEADHKKVSNNCAMVALMMMLKATSEPGNGESAGSDDDAEREVKPVLIETLEYYKGTELDRIITAFAKAGLRGSERVAHGKQLKEKHRDRYLNEALADQGFGSDALDLKSDPLAHCGHCGSVESKELKRCGRCNGAAYCSRDCQAAAWKKHKKECDPILAHGRRLMRDCALRSGVEIKAAVYKPRSTLPTENALITETSGIGSVGILWFPGQKSILNFTDMSNVPSAETLSNAVNDHIAFENLSELVPPLRFLLTCGPLPDINIARNSLDDALRLLNGDITKIQMKAAGFTALEWAAKKGNGETVEWLCTDDRTNVLVNVGSPVGWACYTGQVAIARALVAHGADPKATNAVLWQGTPPLLVAAQNGQLEAMQYLVDELGQDIHMRDRWGRDVMLSIKTAPNWKELEGHKRSYEWAKEKMG